MSGAAPVSAPRRLEERNVPPALQGLVSRVLRGGVIVSGVLLAAGVLWEAAAGRGNLLAAAAPTTGPGFGQLLRAGGPAGLVLFGVLVLVVTPLTRVAISVTLFSAARDRTFAAITLFVLAILGATIAVGVLR